LPGILAPVPAYGVLVFPGGTEIGLELRRALAELKEVRLAGAGSEQDRHGPFAYRDWRTVLSVGEPGWIDGLNAVVDELEIDVIFPGHDDVLLALAEHAGEIRAGIVTSPVETCRITRSKRATYELLADVIPVPQVFAAPHDVGQFPVFAKPDRSQGSQGAVLLPDAPALMAALAGGSDLVMEYLPGRELTVDCFSDRERGVLFARARPRERTRAGISMATRTEPDRVSAAEHARAIAARLELHGAWFFQLREDRHGEPRLLEVAPRVAGTSALHRVLGVNFPLLSLYEHLRMPVALAPNDIDVRLDRALVNRYAHDLSYRHVYVDLDDTLLVGDSVNARLVAFVYQSINAGRRVVLITRHAQDVDATLDRFRLSALWDKVIHIEDPTVEKADHIGEPDAILIDDSFRERRVARERLGIATFDSSMIELLWDERL
jgi:carbamoyl-phosphate synthase large subunit